MSDLAGALLLRAGVITHEQLSTAARLKERDGGSLGECLIRIGAVEEESLVDFYHRRMMIPRLTPADLGAVGGRALELVPADMAQEFRVLPIEIDAEGSVTVAMADPSDNHACDEIGFFADCFIIRAVASETAIREAIERAYGVRFSSPPASQRVQPQRGPSAQMPAVAPTPVPLTNLKTQGGPPPQPGAPTMMPTHEPTMIGTGGDPLPEPPIQHLRDAKNREEVGKCLLDYFERLVKRAALLVVKKGLLAGQDARGTGMNAPALQRFSFSVDQPSVFREVITSRLPYRGALGQAEVDRGFQRILGGASQEIMLLPIAVRDRVIAVLFADGPRQPLPDAALHTILREAGLAYERLILETS